MAIQTGMYDVALAMGIEKLTNPTFDQIRVVRDYGGGDREREGCMRIFPPGIFAMSARRHMQEFGTTREQIAMVSVKNHYHGTMNPKSAYQKEVSLEEVLASRVIADPLRLLECCPNTDGCAALVLAAKDVLHRFSGDPVWMAGCGQASGTELAGYGFGNIEGAGAVIFENCDIVAAGVVGHRQIKITIVIPIPSDKCAGGNLSRDGCTENTEVTETVIYHDNDVVVGKIGHRQIEVTIIIPIA